MGVGCEPDGRMDRSFKRAANLINGSAAHVYFFQIRSPQSCGVRNAGGGNLKGIESHDDAGNCIQGHCIRTGHDHIELNRLDKRRSLTLSGDNTVEYDQIRPFYPHDIHQLLMDGFMMKSSFFLVFRQKPETVFDAQRYQCHGMGFHFGQGDISIGFQYASWKFHLMHHVRTGNHNGLVFFLVQIDDFSSVSPHHIPQAVCLKHIAGQRDGRIFPDQDSPGAGIFYQLKGCFQYP